MRRLVGLVAAVACLSVSATAVPAQEKYPSRPVKIIGPYGPGGATDIIARVVAEQLRASLGQTFIVENKPGAFGILAIEEMMRGKPDGYTIMVGNNSTNAVTPVVYPQKLSINYDRDVQPILRLAEVPSFMLVTPKDFAPRSMAEVVAYAKANPGKLRAGTVGIGSYPHYDMEILVRRAGIEITHLPIKSGAAGLLKEIVTGDAQIGSVNIATALPMVKSGQVIPVAVSGERRLAEFPDIPTLAELGFGEAGTIQWLGFFAPAGAPKEIVDTLFKSSVDALHAPATQEILKKNFMIAAPSASPEEAKSWLGDEIAKWRRVTTEVKIDVTE